MRFSESQHNSFVICSWIEEAHGLEKKWNVLINDDIEGNPSFLLLEWSLFHTITKNPAVSRWYKPHKSIELDA